MTPKSGNYQFGGKHSETSALKNILAQMNVIAPHSGEPFTEEMLLGIGGGIGGGYWSFDYPNVSTVMVLGFRHNWQGMIVPDIAKRLGVAVTVKETASPNAAEKNLRDALNDGHPVIAWVDLASMPYEGLPLEMVKYFTHVVAVYGIDDHNVYVDDRSNAPLTVAAAQFASGRAAIRSLKNRIMFFAPPKKLKNLKTAVIAGIKSGNRYLLKPPLKNFGLPAFEKWADLMTNTQDKKGWATVFPRGEKLFDALEGVFHYIETNNTGGSAFRSMYAAFLEEAAEAIRKPKLNDAAKHYRELASLWSQLAHSALPDSVKAFKDARELRLRKMQLFNLQGATAVNEIKKVNARMLAIKASMKEKFPLNEGETNALLSDLSKRVGEIHKAEVSAAMGLKKLVG